MSGVATAAVVGTAAVGAYTSYSASKSASKQAEAAMQSADAASQLQYLASKEQLEFAQQQYQDWQGIFGPVQQNLANYYNNMNADTVASLGLQNIEKEYARSTQLLDQALAKRGMTNSGATEAGLTQLEQTRMLGRAQVRTDAPNIVAQQQAGFLGLGLGQQSGLQQGINNAYSNQMNMYGQQYSNQMDLANQQNDLAYKSAAGVGSSISSGINTYMIGNALGVIK